MTTTYTGIDRGRRGAAEGSAPSSPLPALPPVELSKISHTQDEDQWFQGRNVPGRTLLDVYHDAAEERLEMLDAFDAAWDAANGDELEKLACAASAVREVRAWYGPQW